MTGGRVVILGKTGRNFAAGMSGGIAYVLDETGEFRKTRVNTEMVDLEAVSDPIEVKELKNLIEAHLRYTGSGPAKRILDAWDDMLPEFVKVMPRDYKKALEKLNEDE